MIELHVNDRVRMTEVTRIPAQVRIIEATVTWVEHRVNARRGPGIYFGYNDIQDIGTGMSGGAFGATWVFETAPQWGTVDVQVIGKVTPRPAAELPNLVGNPGYDLLHDPRRQWRNA